MSRASPPYDPALAWRREAAGLGVTATDLVRQEMIIRLALAGLHRAAEEDGEDVAPLLSAWARYAGPAAAASRVAPAARLDATQQLHLGGLVSASVRRHRHGHQPVDVVGGALVDAGAAASVAQEGPCDVGVEAFVVGVAEAEGVGRLLLISGAPGDRVAEHANVIDAANTPASNCSPNAGKPGVMSPGGRPPPCMDQVVPR